VLGWIEGEPFRHGDPEALRALGVFLARFHQALAGDVPPGKEGRLREDHPDLLEPYLAAVQALASDVGQQEQLAALAAQLSLVRRELDGPLYDRLPRAVIHGDFHPGNVRFRGPQVAAIYDFDYLGVQARARDLSDAMMFFASRRRQPYGADNIRQMTQPFIPDAALCAPLLAGYESVSRLTGPEWDALAGLIRSRWLQIRLRGSRKVPAAEKVAFVLHDLFQVVAWLDGPRIDFFQSLRRECQRQ
jgi:homoserine kinase type II